MKIITFTFKEDGTVQTDANGYKGKLCISQTDEMLKPVQGKLQSRTLKPEYQQTDVLGQSSVGQR